LLKARELNGLIPIFKMLIGSYLNDLISSDLNVVLIVKVPELNCLFLIFKMFIRRLLE
jgi:hypothetical protein